MWDYPGVVENVHDGDTITVTIDRGFEEHRVAMKLRLEGVFAPELKQLGGEETHAFTQAWLSEHSAPGVEFPLVVTTVRLKNGKREVKTLERYVARVDSPSGESLNKAVAAFVAERGYPRGIGG